MELPRTLLDLEDDPYRSLVWKLKKEGFIKPQPQIPYHEFRWGAWLRRRPLPPFSSRQLQPALAPARPPGLFPGRQHDGGMERRQEGLPLISVCAGNQSEAGP
jgi:hypothetical protein